MNDPYEVLGASPTDSDEEIKRKYRELVKKYHPDNYHNNPLADLAQEKMKAINEAYDTIEKIRAGKTSASSSSGNSYSGSYGSSNGSYSSGSREFAGVRSAINSGDLDYAERILRASSNHNAEWHFLMGSLFYRKGWLDESRFYYQQAVNMEPQNPEYRQALAQMQTYGARYTPEGYGNSGGVDFCELCGALMCANMLCRC